MTFDLNSLALTEEATFQLTHPATGAPLFADKKEEKPVEIVLRGQASQAYRRAVDQLQKNRNKRGGKDATPAQAREESIEFLTTLSVEIRNLHLDGAPVADADAFRKLYSDERFSWIKLQVNDFLGDVGSFLN